MSSREPTIYMLISSSAFSGILQPIIQFLQLPFVSYLLFLPECLHLTQRSSAPDTCQMHCFHHLHTFIYITRELFSFCRNVIYMYLHHCRVFPVKALCPFVFAHKMFMRCSSFRHITDLICRSENYHALIFHIFL